MGWSSRWPGCWSSTRPSPIDPAKAGGLDKALHTLRNQPFGEFLLILAALGLIAFGIYGLAEARWRRV